MIGHPSRRTLLAGAAGAAAALPLGARAQNAAPLGIGFIYVGPTGDYGWTHAHDVARKAIEAEYGPKVKTSYVENVAEGPDAERVLRQLASAGNKLVFATSFGFMNPTVRVARALPNVMFEHATGYQRLPNLATYNARFYEGRAVCGTIAGHVSKAGVAGYIASFPIPEVVMGISAFHLAARKVNPNFRTKVVWASTWYDPAKEADAAKALIDQGCDILCQHTDSPAPLQAAEAKGLLGFGQASDMRSYAPKAQLTAITDDWAPYYVRRVKAVLDGSWKSGDTWDGLKEGAVKMAPYGDAVPANVRAAADATREAIVAGKLHPITGPVKDQKGELRLKDGEAATDEILSKMDWYPEGVQS
ncbi:MAG: BMP family ABC transporter substrate-binding protein [Methylobacteriaceae bacterium]|nr:BMP family ABC transporter substrate-binding protein [Methylobacteriaceae bacterium]